MSAIEAFIEQAWNDHVEDLPGVVARLDRGIALLEEEPAGLDAFLQLAAHVHLEHRGDAQAMQAVLERTAGPRAAQPAAQATIDKDLLTIALLRGEAPGSSPLALPARVRAQGAAVIGLVARGRVAEAQHLLQATRGLARDADADIRPEAIKALAASANNLATQLLHEPRQPEADALMLEAAALARNTWGEAGTWVHVERAEYVLARCHAAAGNGARAVEHARACASICTANAADAFERFFAHEAMARALATQGQREAALDEAGQMEALLAEVTEPGQREYAASTLAKLRHDL